MINIDERTNRIRLTKGDDASIVVNVVDGLGEDRKIYDDDILRITVKDISTNAVIIAKKAQKGTFYFVPADTLDVAVGTYKYDVELETFGGKVYTIVPSSYFQIEEEITNG